MAQWVKNPATMQEMQETQIQSLDLGREDPLEEDVATHSTILAWRIQWTEEPGRLWSIGLQRVRHDRARTHTGGNHRGGRGCAQGIFIGS